MKCSILIPVANERDALRRTLRSLIPEKGEHEVVVVDRGSEDGSLDVAGEHGWVKVVSRKEGMLPAALNAAAGEAAGDVLLFLRPGAVPERGWSGALDTFFRQKADAGYLDVQEAEGASGVTGRMRRLVQKAGERLMGGPLGLTGLAVKRKTFEGVHGFDPVPDFEWMVFAKRLAAAGSKLMPIPHGVMVAPAPGSRHADKCGDLMEDLKAAWQYRKTESFDAGRCRQMASAVVVLGYDLVENPPVRDYFGYAREQLMLFNVERVQSYRAAAFRVFVGGQSTTKRVEQPSGFRVDNHYRTELSKRMTQLLAEVQAQGSDTVLLVRDTCKELTHRQMRELGAGAEGYAGRMMPEAGGSEWMVLWLDAKAFGLFEGWEGDFSMQWLQKRLYDAGMKLDVAAPAARLATDHDARGLYYSGMIERLPGSAA